MEWLNGVMLMSIFCRQGKEIWNDSTVAMTKKGKFIKTWNIRCRQQRLTISCLFSEDTQKPLHGKTFYFDAPESTRVTRLQRKVCYLGGVSVEQVVSFVRSNLVLLLNVCCCLFQSIESFLCKGVDYLIINAHQQKLGRASKCQDDGVSKINQSKQ